MKNYILDRSIYMIKNKYNSNDEELEVIRYGLEGTYLTITKAIFILSLALILDLLKETIIFLCFYNIIRTVSFGLHAKSSLVCLLSSTIIFLSIPYLCKVLIIPITYKYIIFSLETILIIMFSPADTEKRPIISKKRRTTYKLISGLICTAYFMIGIKSKSSFISNVLLFSLLVQLLLINPLSYKIFNLSYNNYKKYTKE